ncbi:MAG: PDZ domain-containing protein [Acidobacteriia bacterium]|nr:PDZ domain-containing protein [Terriglobia bacterium]
MFNRVLISFLALAAFLRAETKLLRFPDIHGDKVVFTYGGDLWTAPVAGGAATRLTAHPGLELFAKFSPDGQWIAFTGQYDGDEQIYVMPSAGGVPRQLTFYPARGPLPPRWGYDNQVYGWSNDGKKVLFRSLRDGWFAGFSRLYEVSRDGGPADPLPMPESGAGALAPSGGKLVYSPRARDFRTEKRYGGGQANQLYIFDTETLETRKISEGDRASRDPMWLGSTIYYDTDRDGHFNLYAYDVPGGKTTQVTFNKTYDIRWPSSDRQGRIVYELNGGLEVFDVKTRKSAPISITVPDDGVARRPARVSAAGLIESAALSPKGERVLFGARGDIFSAPIEKGPTRNLTRTSGAHEKWPRWSPDGSKVAFVSDKGGEEEVWLAPQDGSAPPQQLTQGGKALRYWPEWSPDGKRLALADKDGRLYVVGAADGALTEIAHSTRGDILDYQWAPRGEFLAFSMNNANQFGSVYVWSGADRQLHRITSEYFDSGNPAWDPDGSYLYFLGKHDFAPVISQSEFNYATNRQTDIYALALRKDVKHPFPPESDEVTIAKDEAKKDDAKKEDKPKDLTIDFDGIATRVARVPVDANNYASLRAKSGYLLYMVSGAPYYGRASETKDSIRIFSSKDRKETTLMDDAGQFILSGDGSKVLIRQGATFNLMDATPTGATGKKTVSTAGLYVDRVPAEEWAEIFNEVWRRYRDFFYAPNMHGYDWEGLRKQYAPLLGNVASRSDLNYVISEMISELTVQHAYIDGGDIPAPPRPRVALPGARFDLDAASNRFRIAKIFEGQNEEDIYRSPLTEIGVDAKVGDYVLAINGQDLTGQDDPYRLLRNAADNPVQLTLNSKPAAEGSRTVSFRPITDESKLIYLDWVNANRRKVSELSGGRAGYIHVPDMSADGIREFIKWYYPQIRKDALVVDVRANGGGNVSRMLIERLGQRILAAQFSRTVEDPQLYPDAFAGPMVALLNENSASDGDIFPAMFREAKLGPLIGKRSWGGVVGITDHGQLIDGGHVNVPEFGFANTRGEWIIEGHGVDPDIEVDNDPKSVIEGRDPQLERAVAELMARLKTSPPKLPTRPPDPVKLK